MYELHARHTLTCTFTSSASIIQDFDIELPFLDENSYQGVEMLAYWVKVARVQGQTYEKLFSPAAFLRTPEERTRTGEHFS